MTGVTMTASTIDVKPSAVTSQLLQKQIEGLPQNSLVDLANYIEFLRFKAGIVSEKKEPSSPLRIRKLEDRNLIYLSQVFAYAHLVGLRRSLVRRDEAKPDSSGGVM
jgi:hypothetical protein